MTSFKRTQRKYVQKAYRVRNWREYETGLRARGSLTVWLGLTDGKLANWNSPRPTRRKPGRQRQYSNHAIETTVTLGLVFGLASRQTEGFLRSLLTLLNLDNDVPDHSTISRRKARLGKVASYERRTVKPVHLLIDSSGLSVHVGQLRTPPKARDYRKLHLAVDEQTSDVVACELTSKRARDASRVASLVGQIERPIASAKADAAYDTGDVYKTLENHRAHRSPKVLIPPRKGAQLALDSAGTRQRNRNIRARSRVGKRKWYVASGYSRRSKVETTFHRYKAILGSAMRARGLGVPESRGEVGVQDPEHHDGARDTRWRDDRMTGRRSHGRLSALNGVVHQGSVLTDASRSNRSTSTSCMATTATIDFVIDWMSSGVAEVNGSLSSGALTPEAPVWMTSPSSTIAYAIPAMPSRSCKSDNSVRNAARLALQFGSWAATPEARPQQSTTRTSQAALRISGRRCGFIPSSLSCRGNIEARTHNRARCISKNTQRVAKSGEPPVPGCSRN